MFSSFLDHLCRTVFLFIFLLSLGCVKNTTDVVKMSTKSSKDVLELKSVVIDKITDEYGTIRDINFGSAYGVSRDKSTVWIYDIELNELSVNKLEGDGPSKIQSVLNVWAFDSDRFVVNDIRGLYLYNKLGEMSFRCSDLYTAINVGGLSTGFRDNNYNVMVPALNANIPLEGMNYFNRDDIFFLAKVNLKSCRITVGGEIGVNSIYKKQDIQLRERGLIEKLGEDKLILFHQYDTNLQVLNKDDLSLIRSVRIDPRGFGEIKPARDRSLQEMSRIAQVNSSIIRVKATSDGRYIVVQHMIGKAEFEPTEQFLMGEQTLPERWIEIYDLDDYTKVYSNTGSLPDDAILVSAKNLNEVYFTSNTAGGNEGTYLVHAAYGN